ncbi:MAG: hypothetical protein J0M02_14945 [Planctomycetes bacterium]|nr:hypothetical protein [Planctomycetota bacterium]
MSIVRHTSLLVAAAAFAHTAEAVRIDLDATAAGIRLEAAAPAAGTKTSVGQGTWIADPAKQACFLSVRSALAAKAWTQVGCTFTPAASGKVVVILRGPWSKPAVAGEAAAPIPVSYDAVTVQGAVLANGSFEEKGAEASQPYAGWKAVTAAGYPRPAGAAKDGSAAVSVWHDGHLSQVIEVTAGSPVTLTAWAWSDRP